MRTIRPKFRLSALIGLALAAFAMVTAAAAEPAGSNDDEPVKAVFKFVKTGMRAERPAVRWLPASCPACNALDAPAFDRENPLETLIALRLPRRRSLELRFKVEPGAVKRVLLQTGDLAFRIEGDELVLPVPPLWSDAVFAGEMATHIVEPGMVLRFEHANPLRRAGKYATGMFPSLERRAADNLEFAQREFIRSSGLGRHLEQDGLGQIMLMGFDTNYPFGHTDFPAHFHMHLRWPVGAGAGTQIGHYYIDSHGLVINNVVGWVGVGAAEKVFARGETFTTRDLQGHPAYMHTVTPEGWVRIARPGQPPCLIRPVATSAGAGFDTGAALECPGRETVTIRVEDDLSAGLVRVSSNRVDEIFRYDPDTGRLLSPTVAPPVSESAYKPLPY